MISGYFLLSQLKESKKAVNSIRLLDEDDDDDVEKVSWSGEPIGSKLPSSTKFHLCCSKAFSGKSHNF